MSTENPLERFLSDNYKEAGDIVEALYERQVITQDHRDALYLALIDIAESVNKAYGEIIPKLLDTLDGDYDELWDAYFDLRFEFRHVDYHIHDADFTELSWTNPQKQDDGSGSE